MVLFQRNPSITPAQTARRLTAGELTLIDVREPAEVREARIDGANIPLARAPRATPPRTTTTEPYDDGRALDLGRAGY